MAVSQKLDRRIIAFGVIILIIFLILLGRLAYLQLVLGDKFYEQAEGNRINYQTISAPRGKILTSAGEILVTNKMAYSVLVRNKALSSEENVAQVVNGLSNILKIPRQAILENLLRHVTDGQVDLLDKLTLEEKVVIITNQKRLLGMSIQRDLTDQGEVKREYLRVNLRSVSTTNLIKACQNLAELFSLSYEQLLIEIIAKGIKDQSTTRIKRNLSQAEMVILEENLHDLPGVVVDKVSIRDYVKASTLSHVLGYMGAIDIHDLKMFKDQGYRGDDYIGQDGLEREYESYLRGVAGREQFEVDSKRRKIRTLGVNKPLPGANLYLNIDLALQKKVEKLLEEALLKLAEEAKTDPDLKGGPKGGTVIVMDPQTGKILAMASNPSLDPNLFAAGISEEALEKFSTDSNEPFKNKALTLAPPGSIFKVVSAAAFLEEKVVDENTQIMDENGRYSIGEWTYDNWAREIHGGYGLLKIEEAIAHSNNIYFYTAAHRLYDQGKGGVALSQYARDFGLGRLTGIDLPYEKAGFVPDRQWKEETKKEIWLPGESLHFSIGQGYLTTSPIQLISYIAAIGNGGKIYRPYIVDRIESYDGQVIQQFAPEVVSELSVSSNTLEIIKNGMVGVTTYGSANHAFGLPITVAGKTGTAQTRSDYANHGWFAGFAPADDPQIAILIFINQGVSSRNTLPIVSDILKYCFHIPDLPVEEAILEQTIQPTMEAEMQIESLVEQAQEQQPEPSLTDKLKEFYKDIFSSS